VSIETNHQNSAERRRAASVPTASEISDGPRVLSVNGFCERYSLSRASFYRLASSGRLRTFKILGKRVVRVEDAEAALFGEAA
jgi:hypothetical protein